LAGSMGMDQAQVGRQPNMPPSRRFRELNETGRRNAEFDADTEQEQIDREMQELEEHGVNQ